MSAGVLPEHLHPTVRQAQQVQAQGEGHVQLHNPLKNGPEQDVLRNAAYQEVSRFDNEDEYETPTDDLDSIVGSDDDIGTDDDTGASDDETGASDDEDDAGDDQAVPNDETVDVGDNANFAGDGGGNKNIAVDPRNDVNPAKVVKDRGDQQNMSESSEEDPMSGLEPLQPDFSCFSGVPSPRPKYMTVKPPYPKTPTRKNRIKMIIAGAPCNRVASPPFKHAVRPKKLRIPLKPAAVKNLISSSARDHRAPQTIFKTPKKAPPERERDRRARPAKKARSITGTPQLIKTRRNRPLAGRPFARKIELPTTEASSTRRIEGPTYHPRQESWNKQPLPKRNQALRRKRFGGESDEDGTKAPPSTPRGKKAQTTTDLPQNGGNMAAVLIGRLKIARRSLKRTKSPRSPRAPPSTPRQSKRK